MSFNTILPLLSNGGVAGIVLILFMLGHIYPRSVVDDLKAERDALRQAVLSERDRADAAVSATQATRDVFSALQAGMEMRAGMESNRSRNKGGGA